MTDMRTTRQRTLASEIGALVGRLLTQERAGLYPLVEYQTNPVRYVKERLRFPYLFPWQEELMTAVARGIRRSPDGDGVIVPPFVAVRAGQKNSKTCTAVLLGYWYYECFPRARVFQCAAIEAQTERVLWNEMLQQWLGAKARGVIMDGKLAASSAGGLVSSDGLRSIRGISGQQIEALAGISGENLFFIIDEASALTEKRAQAFMGNAMGGAAYLWLSQPTRNEGPFFDAFNEKAKFFQLFHWDSEKVAQWQHDHGVKIGGVATIGDVEKFGEMYGKNSPFWHLRVKGDWLLDELGHGIQMWMIKEAIERWPVTGADGVLSIGVDPAGKGEDETAFAVVRGRKLLALYRFSKLTEDQIIGKVQGFVAQYRNSDETPNVMLDVDGIGADIGHVLGPLAERLMGTTPREGFRFHPVKSSLEARNNTRYGTVRDELYASLCAWMETGAIPPDYKLQVELHASTWYEDRFRKNKKLSKDDIRKKIGRSPDGADALELAVFNPNPGAASYAQEARAMREERARMQPHQARDDGYYGSIGDHHDGSAPFETHDQLPGQNDYLVQQEQGESRNRDPWEHGR
jgi:phage terminase large subunit